MADLSLTAEQRRTLHRLLMEAFPQASALERMVYFGLGANLGAIASGGSLSDLTFGLMRWAEANHRLAALIQAAVEENPTNDDLGAFAAAVLPAPPETVRPSLVSSSSPPPPLAEMARRERLYVAISQLSAEGWAQVLVAVGEDPAMLPGTTPLAQARSLVPRLATDGVLGVLVAWVERQGTVEQVAAQVADRTRQFAAAQKRKDWDAAIALGEQILGLDEQQRGVQTALAVGYWERGKRSHSKGDYVHSIADFTRALSLVPHQAASHILRAVTSHAQKDHARAIAEATAAIEIEPQQASYYYLRAESKSGKGEYELAIADYTHAIDIDPQNALYYKDRGVSYSKKREDDRAIADYSHAIALDPQNALYYRDRGVSYHFKGEYDRAIADYTHAIALDPQQADYYRQRGVSYFRKGEYDRAIADYSRAIELNLQNGEYHYLRGRANQAKGDKGAARADFERALALGYEQARAELAKL